MMSVVRRIMLAFLLVSIGWVAVTDLAHAQADERGVFTPAPDESDVDLISGGFSVEEAESELPGAPRLKRKIAYHERGSITNNLRAVISATVDTSGWNYEGNYMPDWPRIYSVTFNGITKTFNCGPCEPEPKDGSYLEFLETGETAFVDSDGTRVIFPMLSGETDYQSGDKGYADASRIIYPDGEKVSFQYSYNQYDGHGQKTVATSNTGYSVFMSELARTTYKDGVQIEHVSAGKTDVSDLYNYSRFVSDALGRQFKVHYDTTAPWASCTGAIAWSQGFDGVRTDYGYYPNRALSDYGKKAIYSLTRNGRTWYYSNVPGQRTTTRPDGSTTNVTATSYASGGGDGCAPAAAAAGFITSQTAASGRVTQFAYGQWGDPSPLQMVSATLPEGDKYTYEYDERGNLTGTTHLAKSGGASSPVYQAGFPAVCTAAAVCNKPAWTKDDSLAQTDYTYDPVHGGLATKLEPAGANGLRRKTWNEYAPFDTGDGIIWRLSAAHVCSVFANGSNNDCGSINDDVTRFTYWGKTFLPLTVTKTNGANTISAVATYSYDIAGRPLTITDPTGLTRYFRYDAAGRRTWEVLPNPIGGFTARHLAYDAGDNVTRVDVGTIPSAESETIAIARTELNTYSADGNLVKVALLNASGNKIQNQQISYDLLDRPICTASRLNPGGFDTTADACGLGPTGAFGPDRITKKIYDLDGRLTKVIEGFGALNSGAGVAVDEISYSGNGQILWRQDGNGNRTNYAYDGFDRLLSTTFADNSQEILGYDASGRVGTLTKRDGNYLSFSYDAAGRLASTAYSNGEAAVSRTYDGIGRPLTISQGGNSLQTTYDALGRPATSSSNGLQLSYLYDLAGRRTRLTYPDGYYATYEYGASGELMAVRENGSAALASFSYDGLGRRTGISRPNGTSSTFSYDAADLLQSLNQDLAGTAGDFSRNYTYNPVGQVTSEQRTNDAYAWTGYYNVNRSYSVNLVNQYTNAGDVSFGYDGRGNLTQSGPKTFAYTLENRLVSAAGVTLTYDPEGSLLRIQGATGRRMLYDADMLVAEYDDSGNLTDRYVHGLGEDEPLVWYRSGDAAPRRWLYADAQGSIAGVAPDSGAPIAFNRYDEYGIPESVPGDSNAGRFRYTGQTWLPELGMYYFKARIYSPTLGRFMQTDPIGYSDGLNLYAYANNDPANQSDPSGLESACKTTKVRGAGAPVDAGTEIVVCGKREKPGPGAGLSLPPSGAPKQEYAVYRGVLVPAPRPLPQDPNPDRRRDGCGRPYAPAARSYSVPEGSRGGADPQNRFVRDAQGKLQVNPYYAAARQQAGGVNRRGVIFSLAKIGGQSLFPFRDGAMTLKGARILVGGAGAKQAYESIAGKNSQCRR